MEKPKYEVGQKISVRDYDDVTEYEIKAIRQETSYPTGEHLQFLYVVEMSITLKSGYKIPPCVHKYSEKSFEDHLKPESRDWYSICVE